MCSSLHASSCERSPRACLLWCAAVSTVDRTPLELPPSAPVSAPADFASRLVAIGVHVGAPAIARLGDYLGRLLAMNQQMNLTAIKDADSAWERLVLDSLTLLPLLAGVAAGARVVDIGSGGGLPGIPLAIMRPDLFVTLVEATQKKAAFLIAVSQALELNNVTVLAERAETLARSELRGTFDVVTARAVARLKQLIPWVVPFARPAGLVLLVKGQKAEDELAEARAVLSKENARHESTTSTPTGRIVALRKNS